MMDYLEKAQRLLEQAQNHRDASEEKNGNAYYRGKADEAMQHAAIYAAIAQAEQLKRIADALSYTRQSGTTVNVAQLLDRSVYD